MNESQVPYNRKCQKDFGLSKDQVNDFYKCYQKRKAISFCEQDLLPEERESMIQIFKAEKDLKSVSEQTLIAIDLVKHYYDKWTSELEQETELFQIIHLHRHISESSVYVNLILSDNYAQIAQDLLQIFKKSKNDYKKAAQILRKYTLKFENCELEKLIKLSREEDLLGNAQKQKEVEELLQYFEQNDTILYLMILHELWIDGEQSEQSSQFEEIILEEKHLKVISAVAQLFILDKSPQLKAEVAQKRVYIDHQNEQAQFEIQLEEQLKVIMRLKESNQDDQIGSEQDNNKLMDTIKALATITNKNIKVHQMSELKHFLVFSSEQEIDQSTLLLVFDEINKIFQVMITYKNEQKFIDFSQLQDLKKKLPFLSNHFSGWLETFIQLPSFRRVLSAEQDVETSTDEQKVLKLLQKVWKTQAKYILCKDTNNKKKMKNTATQLWNLDNQLLKEWLNLQEKNDKMNDFFSYMINSSARENSYWALRQVSSLQEYFKVDALKITLKEFNRVQTRSDLNQRVKTIELLKDLPKELSNFIINTMFGFILRKEDLSVLQCELQSVIKGSLISLRFLIAYLIQSAEMGLRARLSYYLCQNYAVPLIMNCQETYKEQKLNLLYNQELIFSMEECEGVGVFSFGIGRMATSPCGKSEISNMIVTPKSENKIFDTNDMNVLSNGQIDVFLEKCYQEKNGWAFMDGQGKIPNKILLSILPLTNILLVHFFEQDATEKKSVEKLRKTLKLVKENDGEILICLILRDCSETKVIAKKDYPDWLPMKDQVDKLIAIVDLNQVEKQNKLNEIEKVLLYFNTKVREIHKSDPNKQKFTKDRFLQYFCHSDGQGLANFQRISEILKLTNEFLKEVQELDSNVFNEKGLPSLKLKDEIRAVNLKLQQFSVMEEEEQVSAVNRQKQLQNQLEKLNTTLQELEINSLMQKFWQIVNHKDAILIKIELSKGLVNFTQKNTSLQVEKKYNLLKEN